MTEKEFAALVPQIFSSWEQRLIKRQTAGGPSALQVVRKAVRSALQDELLKDVEMRERVWGAEHLQRFPEDKGIRERILR